MLRLNINRMQCLNFKSFLKGNLQYFRSTSSKVNTKETNANSNSTPSVKSSIPFNKDEINMPSTKYQNKMPPREPLIKNLFIGKVDKELLAFPEVIPRDDMAKLREENTRIQSYFENNFDIQEIETTRSIPKEVKDDLRNLGLFGLNVPQSSGGRGYFWSESLLVSEAESNCPDVALVLLSHRLVADVLQNFGTDYQKDKYLSKIADGTIIATEAIFEANVAHNEFFNTSAKFETINGTWTLNGEKSFIVNGTDANLLLVLAQTEKLDNSGIVTPGITVFLIDTTMPGVKIENNSLSFGCRAAGQSTAYFNQVQLTNDHMLGNLNEGNEVAQDLIKAQRLRSSMLALALSKRIIKEITEYSVVTKHSNIYLKDMDMISNRLSAAMCKIYAIESMIYFTSGLIDEFDKQDTNIEAALTKLYAMENLWMIACTGMEFMGPKYLQSGQPGELHLRNAAQLYTQSESLESLRLFISLTGLQHAGMEIYTNVTKTRNPLFNPGHVLNKFFQTSSIEIPKTKMFLEEELHPSLAPAAQCLEHSVARLQLSVEILLTRYGTEIIEKHVEMKRLTEIISLIYAMFCSLSRSSRSYCIGLKLADHEMLTATSICLEARNRIKSIALDIESGPYVTNDKNLQRLSKQIMKSRGCYTEHPLTFNY